MLHNLKRKIDSNVEEKSQDNVTLGNVTENISLYPLPDNTGLFHYFKLNDHSQLVMEGARLIAERIKSLNYSNPYFVTAESSTLALAHVLRSQYGLDGLTLYKTIQINDVEPMSIDYQAITSTKPQKLYLGKNKIARLENKNLFVIDSVCTKGGTLQAIGNLLLKAGVSNKNIVEADVLFTEGEKRNSVELTDKTQLKINHFSHLPIVKKPLANLSLFKPVNKPTIKIVVASTSPCKIKAATETAERYYKNCNVQIIPIATKSGVPEQPFGNETEQGAANRLEHAKSVHPNADLYIAVESGLFEIDNKFIDKAVIKLQTKDGTFRVTQTEGVEFPKQYVELARQLGFDKTTVGECMFKAGIIHDPKDPHKDLGEKISRDTLISDSLLCGMTAIHAQNYSSENKFAFN